MSTFRLYLRQAMRRSIWVSAASVLIVAGCGATSTGNAHSAKSPIKIGIEYSQSGVLASLATPSAQAAELAIQQANAHGGIDGHPIAVTVEDTTSNPSTAAQDAHALVQDGVNVVLGTATGGDCRAAAPILEAAQVLQFCWSNQVFKGPGQPEGSGPQLNKFFFESQYPVSQYPQTVASWLEARNIHTIGIIETVGPVATASASIFIAAEKLDPGLKIISTQSFASGDTNISAQMTVLKAANPDLIEAGTSGSDIIPVVEAMNALGMKQPLYVSTGSAIQSILTQVKHIIVPGGMYSASAWVDLPGYMPQTASNYAQVQSFVKAYQAKYNAVPGEVEAAGYDSAQQVITALRAGARTGAQISAYLTSHTFTGVLGTYHYTTTNHQPLALVPLMMSFGANGRFQLAYEPSK